MKLTDRDVLLVAYGALKALSLDYREKLDKHLLEMVEQHLFPNQQKEESDDVSK
jgi:hypothetical protein